MSEFLEKIERASSDGRLVTSDGGATWLEMTELAKKAAQYCTENGERHAVLLGNTQHSAAFVMGALRAGTDVCSLHLPHRGQDLLSYARDIKETMQYLETATLLVPGSMTPLFDGSGITVKPIESACDGRSQDSIKEGGRLVQFTSGSTADPNPVPLSLDQIAANVEAIMHRIGMGENWIASSWLPLSHDMGLCGMLMCSWYVNAPFTLRDPSEFMSDPMVWLRDISNTGSMVTAAPNFALPLVLRALSRSKDKIDLSTLRCLILGGEMNRPSDLLKFYQSLEEYGLKRTALCPAYGMAEAVLAVSIDSPDTEPRVAMLERGDLEKPETIDPERIQYRSLFEQGGRDDLCVLGAGDLLEGYTVKADSSATLMIDGPSVFDGYLSKDRRSGMHQTRDIGFVHQNHVFPLGRSDEVIVVRGRNLPPAEVEAAAWGPARPGLAAAVPDGAGGLALVVEIPRDTDPKEQVQALRRQVTNAVGVGPSRITVVAAGTLPKTASGKIRRREVALKLENGSLEFEYDHRFGRN